MSMDPLNALLSSPSQKSWKAICKLMEGWPDGPDRDAAMAHADAKLSEWPETSMSMLSGWPMPSRFATDSWAKKLMKGEVPRGWSLVRFLQYHNRPLTQTHLHNILGCGQLHRLTHLYFGETRLSPPLAGALADAADHLPALTGLSLYNNTLTGDRMADLAVRLGGQLTWLDLSSCTLTDAEVHALIGHPLPKLRGLRIPGGYISAETIELVMRSPNLPAVEMLDLSKYRSGSHARAEANRAHAATVGHHHLRRAVHAGTLTDDRPADLKRRCKAAGLKGYSRLKKHDLIVKLLAEQWDVENPG